MAPNVVGRPVVAGTQVVPGMERRLSRLRDQQRDLQLVARMFGVLAAPHFGRLVSRYIRAAILPCAVPDGCEAGWPSQKQGA